MQALNFSSALVFRIFKFLGLLSSLRNLSTAAKQFTSTNSTEMAFSSVMDKHWEYSLQPPGEDKHLNRTIRTAHFFPQKRGHYYPISNYYVKHYKPTGYDPWGRKKPEVWEYKGQYFYGHLKQKKFGLGHAALGIVAAGLPLILAPLLGMLMTVPVLVPVATDGTGITDGSGTIVTTAGRRRRSSRHDDVPDIEQTLRMRELQLVSNYLQEVQYDEARQSRLLAEYLRCQGMLGGEERCLERLACQFSQRKEKHVPAGVSTPLERTVSSILLSHLLRNSHIPSSFKRRLRMAARTGRKNPAFCFSRFPCTAIDGAVMRKRQGRNQNNFDGKDRKRHL